MATKKRKSKALKVETKKRTADARVKPQPYARAVITRLAAQDVTIEDLFNEKQMKKDYGHLNSFSVRGMNYVRTRYNAEQGLKDPDFDSVPRMIKEPSKRHKAGFKLVAEFDYYPAPEKARLAEEAKEAIKTAKKKKTTKVAEPVEKKVTKKVTKAATKKVTAKKVTKKAATEKPVIKKVVADVSKPTKKSLKRKKR